MQPQTEPDHRTAPLAFWRIAAAFLGVLHTLFGAPEDVAERHTLTHKPYKLLLSWLRVAEALMRRLLLIEAAAYPKPNTRAILWPKRPRTRREVAFFPDKPEDWRVCFRCFASAPNGRQTARRARQPAKHYRKRAPTNRTHERIAPARSGRALPARPEGKRKRISREDRWCFDNRPPMRFHSAWPLAERYEALIRVFNAPAPYARRLAKRLHAEPHRLVEVLAAPAEYQHRVDCAGELTTAAVEPWRSKPDTS